MKIKIKLNIQDPREKGIFEGSWGNSVLDWRECWLKTEYHKKSNSEFCFCCYVYPEFWMDKWKKDGHVMWFNDIKYLRQHIKEIEESINNFFNE